MTTLLQNTRRHDITFNADGRIEISARVTKALDIKPGDVIDVALSDREVYLYVKHRQPAGRHKAQCYCTGKGKTCRSLRTNCVEICRQILDLRGYSATRAQLPVGDAEDIPGIGKALPIIIRYKCC